MKNSSKILVCTITIILGITLITGIWFIGTRNSLIGARENIEEQLGNIDTELQSRLDKIPNLMNSVKGFMNYESETYKQIAALRSGIEPYVEEKNGTLVAKENLTEEQKFQLEESSSQLVKEFRVTVEKYPELKDTLMVGFMDELSGTENRIKVARREYNELVRSYNSKVKLFPSSIVAEMSGFEEMEYYEADEEASKAPAVDFEN